MGGTKVDLLLAGGLVLTMDPDRRVLEDGYVAIDAGRITAVGDRSACDVEAADTIDTAGSVVLPGFVNTHAHLLGAFVRGLGSDRAVDVHTTPADRPAASIRLAMDEEAAYAAARLGLVEMLRSGVTTTTDSQPALRGLEALSDGALRAVAESGIRARWYRSSIDRTDIFPEDRHDDAGLAASEHARLRRRWAGPLLDLGIEAMALHRVSDGLLADLAELAAGEQASLAMHISYSEAAARHARERFGEPLLLGLARRGVLDERFLGYHPVWVNRDEIVAAAGSAAGFAYCPVDNMLIGCGTAPLPALLAAGARVGLGLDQPNDGHDFFQLMKAAILAQRAGGDDPVFGSPELALELATIRGAEALGLDAEIGSLEPGKQADVTVLDAAAPELAPVTGRLSGIVYAAGPRVVDTVVVAGHPVVRRGQHVTWSEGQVAADADEAMRRVWRRAGLGEPRPSTGWPLV